MILLEDGKKRWFFRDAERVLIAYLHAPENGRIAQLYRDVYFMVIYIN
jgi:hypothetical protein